MKANSMSAIEETSTPVFTEQVSPASPGDTPRGKLFPQSAVATTRLNTLAIRGTVWTLGSYAASQLIRLAGNVILTRLLVPQYFGLMTLLSTILTGLYLFSDFGVSGSVTRDPRGDEPTFLNTAWTIQVLRGLFLWLVCIAFAKPAADFYHESRLLIMLPVVGLTTVFTGFNSIKLSRLIRHLSIREVALFEIATQVVQISVSLVWALIYPSVWALVGGWLVGSSVRTLASHLLLSGHRDRFGWEKQSVASIIEFGKWIFVAGAVFYLASQSDRLIIGHLVSIRSLALYGIAFSLADIPRQIILAFTTKVVFPFTAKFTHLPRGEYRALILRYRRIVLLLSAMAIAAIVNVADLFFVRIYDSRYWSAAWMIPLFAIGLWHTVLYTTSSQSLVALGKSVYNAVGYSLSAVVLYVGVPMAFHRYGMPGAVLVVAFSDIPMYLVNAYGLYRENLQVFAQDLWATAFFLMVCGAGVAIRFASGVSFPKMVFLH
jgi:O-antigen/teichoic acid export membrane protein